jgi:hypothetical protein
MFFLGIDRSDQGDVTIFHGVSFPQETDDEIGRRVQCLAVSRGPTEGKEYGLIVDFQDIQLTLQ